MPRKPHVLDYETVNRRGRFNSASEETADEWHGKSSSAADSAPNEQLPRETPAKERATSSATIKNRQAILRRGHLISYAGLFLFTVIVFVRPYEVVSSLSWTQGSAFWIATATLVFFLPSQLLLEGNLTARTREVNLVLLLVLFALLSIPLATSRTDAWNEFNSAFIKVVVMFIVMVNVVRTRFRLTALLVLGLAVSTYVSINAINDYRLGRLEEMGVRIAGKLGGMLQNPNDLALYLVTMVPIAVGLLLSARTLIMRIVYAMSAVLMLVAIIVTFSRGGFIGLVAVVIVLGLKLRRGHRALVTVTGTLLLVVFLALLPGKYGSRLASIVGKDPTGSAGERTELLVKSFIVSLRHPLLGIGMGNFHIYSNHEQVSHNAYTQVSAEMGIAAAIVYVMFIAAPLRKLRRLEQESFETRRRSKGYYLAVALQASLIGYMFASFFVSVAYLWYIYYLVGYAICARRLYGSDASPGRALEPP